MLLRKLKAASVTCSASECSKTFAPTSALLVPSELAYNPKYFWLRLRLLALAVVLAVTASSGANQAKIAAPAIRAVDIGHGITLHYVDEGTGVPVIFVHGSLSDGGYWADQIGPFAQHYRAIAYSRRYNYPNDNPARSGYSAIIDAEDLAAFIHTLHLGKVVVIGHSYGAFAALFLAARHPELVRALVLAEPPVVSLLTHLPSEQEKAGTIWRLLALPLFVLFLGRRNRLRFGLGFVALFNGLESIRDLLRGLSNSMLELCVRACISCQFLAQFRVKFFRGARQRQRSGQGLDGCVRDFSDFFLVSHLVINLAVFILRLRDDTYSDLPVRKSCDGDG
jgi:pimeloyl-ACP methyl ester carboxylesterase